MDRVGGSNGARGVVGMEGEVNDLQVQLIRGFGEEIAHIVRWWRPAIPINRCPMCGLRIYHIISHVSVCQGHEIEPGFYEQLALPLRGPVGEMVDNT